MGQNYFAKVGVLEAPQRSSAFFQIKSACEAADLVNSFILASNQVLHKRKRNPYLGQLYKPTSECKYP